MMGRERLDRPVILASRSPRRAEILSRMDIPFETDVPGISHEEEVEFLDVDNLDASLQRLAREKAVKAARRHREALVLGADTVVVLRGALLGKPESEEEAAEMLARLSGRRHRVLTGVALLCDACGFSRSAVAATDVTFRRLPEGDIRTYLQKEEYSDKAGAYAIQGAAMTFVKRIEGCFFNVMGLPVFATIRLFKDYAATRS